MIDSRVWGWLQKNGNASQQIEKLVREKMEQEKRLLEIAEAIYSEISGADSKEEHSGTVSEIYDWLFNGDNPTGYTMEDVPAFVKEWKEYQGQ